MKKSIADRYAKAFFLASDIPVETKQQELTWFTDVLNEQPQLKQMLQTPVIPYEKRHALLTKLLKQKDLSTLSFHFFLLLLECRRIDYLSAITNAFATLVDEIKNTRRITVKTAQPLSTDKQAQLIKSIETMCQQTIHATYSTEPSLLGGIIVQIGDTVYDNSLRKQLENITL